MLRAVYVAGNRLAEGSRVGPDFISRSSIFFLPSLPFGVRHDLFWRLKLKHPEKFVVSCHNVMFDTYEREVPDERYVALAQKWDVKKWVESSGRVRWYGCRRAYSHTSKRSCTRLGHREKGMAIPPCDLENLADAVKFIMKVCEEAGLYCELEDGTILGISI